MDPRSVQLPISGLTSDGWSLSESGPQRLVTRLSREYTSLSEYVDGKTYFGIKTGLNKAFIIDQDVHDSLIDEDPKSIEILKPLLEGRNVRRYSIEYKNKYLIWTYIGVPIGEYPAVMNHLEQFKDKLQKRWDQGDHWWELRSCSYYPLFEEPKIIYPDIATTCRFSYDSQGFFGSNTTYFIPGTDLYLLGILNSKLGQFYFTEVCAGLEGGGTTYLRFFGQYIEDFPVRKMDLNSAQDVVNHENITSMVRRMLELNEQFRTVSIPTERELIDRQIDALDAKLDEAVYDIYDLSMDERSIVETA
jgi:hypothetical protein